MAQKALLMRGVMSYNTGSRQLERNGDAHGAADRTPFGHGVRGAGAVPRSNN
jgi:hypothetical protein